MSGAAPIEPDLIEGGAVGGTAYAPGAGGVGYYSRPNFMRIDIVRVGS
jgi:hypothetical protein